MSGNVIQRRPRRGPVADSTQEPMSMTSETLVQAIPQVGPAAESGPERRSDIDAKQARVAALL